MNSKGHLIISVMKSILRISACITTLVNGNVIILASGFFLAEFLGIMEELVDKR
jgi:hypothetical protein